MLILFTTKHHFMGFDTKDIRNVVLMGHPDVEDKFC